MSKSLSLSELNFAAASARDKKADRLLELGAAVWGEMKQLGIVPTPRAYEVWFAHRSLANHALSACIEHHVEQGACLTPALLDNIHRQFLSGAEIDVEEVSAGAEAIQAAADSLIRSVAGNQAAVAEYGDSLSGWASRLAGTPTISSLAAAVAALTAATTNAAERNRVLEQQLAAAITRVSKLRQSLNVAKTEATTDALTAITNRRAFDAKLKRVAAQVRADPSLVVSVILFDVDHFKRFNDVHGHRIGDLVLRLVARLLSESVKGRDTVSRYGGEEFAILLIGADARAAAVVATQICEAMAGKRLAKSTSKRSINPVTLSAGVAQYQPGEALSSWMERADLALYQAKENGRNRVCSETGGGFSGAG